MQLDRQSATSLLRPAFMLSFSICLFHVILSFPFYPSTQNSSAILNIQPYQHRRLPIATLLFYSCLERNATHCSPNRSVCLLVCLPVWLLICLPVCLSVCLPACLSVCLSGCLSACLPISLSVCLPISLSV